MYVYICIYLLIQHREEIVLIWMMFVTSWLIQNWLRIRKVKKKIIRGGRTWCIPSKMSRLWKMLKVGENENVGLKWERE